MAVGAVTRSSEAAHVRLEAVVRHGKEQLLADPERLVALGAEHGTQIVGDYPG
jgi:hypothetical protein